MLRDPQPETLPETGKQFPLGHPSGRCNSRASDMSAEPAAEPGTEYQTLSEAEKCCYNAILYKQAQAKVREVLEFFEGYFPLDQGSFEAFEDFIGKMSSPDGLEFAEKFLQRVHQESARSPESASEENEGAGFPDENPFEDEILIDPAPSPRIPTQENVLDLLKGIVVPSRPTTFTAKLLAEMLSCSPSALSGILKNLKVKGIIFPDPHLKAPTGGVLWVVNLFALEAEVGK